MSVNVCDCHISVYLIFTNETFVLHVLVDKDEHTLRRIAMPAYFFEA